MIDLLDSGGDLTLVTEGIKNLIDVTEVRNETFNRITKLDYKREIKLGTKFIVVMGIPRESQPI